MASLKKEEASTDDLPYGQFGTAEYDCNDQQWRFQRTANPRYVIQSTGEIQQISLPSLLNFTDHDDPKGRDPDSIRRAKQIADLVSMYPEVQPASEFLPNLLQVSEAVESAARSYEPLQGRLLDFGHIGIAPRVRIVAFPTGPTGSDLKLQLVSGAPPEELYDANRNLEVPGVRSNEATVKGPGSAIQQIRFSHPRDDGHGMLAVRYLSGTKLFRPALRARPLQPNSPSRLEAVLLADIAVHQTGGTSHVDVALNPNFDHQFALIDQDGAWSVWDLPRKPYAPKCIHRGTLTSFGEAVEHHTHDGWAKIDWVLNPGTFMIITRHRIRLVALNGAKTRVVRAIEHESGILDAAILPLDWKNLAALTYTHVEIWDLGDPSNEKPLLSIRHFRSIEDPSLRLSVFPDDEEIVVLILSHLSKTTQVYRLGVDRSGSFVILSDPVSLVLGPFDQDPVLDIHLSRLQRDELNEFDSSMGFGSGALSQGRAYYCTVLTASLAGFRMLCHALPRGVGTSQVSVFKLLDKNQMTTASRRRTFVIDDAQGSDGSSLLIDDEENDRPITGASDPLGVMQPLRDRSGPSWTMDYSIVARHIKSIRQPIEQTLDNITEHSRGLLDNDIQPRSIPTLADAIQEEVTLPDLEQSTAQLEELSKRKFNSQSEDVPLAGELGDLHPVLRCIPLTFAIDLQPLQADSSLSTIYRSMVSEWVAPLSQHVHSGTRLAKEQVIRKVAMQLALATRVIMRERSAEAKEIAVPKSSSMPTLSGQGAQWELPLRPPTDGMSSPFKWPATAPGYPPTPTTTASMITSSSMQTMSQELHRLSAYTSITRTTPIIGSRAVGSVLSHWQIGEDPASYDWTMSSRRAARQAEADELEDAEMTEKERARLRRRAERHLNRQRREAAASEAARRQSSQAPVIVSASQPHADRRRIKAEASSQQPDPTVFASSQTQTTSQDQGTEHMIASQVQPGRFGGRPIARKRKRKSGF